MQISPYQLIWGLVGIAVLIILIVVIVHLASS